jgi:hypothetical protein
MASVASREAVTNAYPNTLLVDETDLKARSFGKVTENSRDCHVWALMAPNFSLEGVLTPIPRTFSRMQRKIAAQTAQMLGSSENE